MPSGTVLDKARISMTCSIWTHMTLRFLLFDAWGKVSVQTRPYRPYIGPIPTPVLLGLFFLQFLRVLGQ